MIKSLSILFLCLLLGEAASAGLALPVPGNVIGMVLLALGLQRRLIRIEDVKPASEVLLKNMAFLFIPPGVGLILYLDLLAEQFWAILLALAVSTFLVLIVVGRLQQGLERNHG